MKACVVGLGSMGKRRIRLLRHIDDSIDILGVDSNGTRRKEVAEADGITVFGSLSEALAQSPDFAIISTSPLSHAHIITEVMEYGIPVFTELNLVSEGYDVFCRTEGEKKLFLSSTFLYREEVRQLCKEFAGVRATYVYHSGQFLPDWHPWEKIEDYFVSDIRTNGCREIMAIELPWLSKCFGKIKQVQSHSSSQSSLPLCYPDTFQIRMEHESGTVGLISVDVTSPYPSRRFEAWGEGKHAIWEGTPDSLFFLDATRRDFIALGPRENVVHDEGYAPNIIENAYESELRAFLKWIGTGDSSEVMHSFCADREILAFIDIIEGKIE